MKADIMRRGNLEFIPHLFSSRGQEVSQNINKALRDVFGAHIYIITPCCNCNKISFSFSLCLVEKIFISPFFLLAFFEALVASPSTKDVKSLH